MKVGLIDADKFWRKKSKASGVGKAKPKTYPNLTLMKISAWHKAHGDEVLWYDGFEMFDKVYIAKVFSSTPIDRTCINAPVVRYGGSGFCIRLDDHGQEYWQQPNDPNFVAQLPHDMEHIMPDYSLYGINDTAYGYLTRGCPRGCHFCHVAAKEGQHSYKVADLSEWWKGQKNIVLSDPNLLACKDWKPLMQQLADSGAWIDINQGMDARLLTPQKMELINQMRLKTIHFAWDYYNQKDAVLKGLTLFAKEYRKSMSHQAQVFVLTNYDTTHEQDLERIYTLRDLGFVPYVMIYNKPQAPRFYRSLQRWCNNRRIFYTIKRFDDYDPILAKE